MHGWDRQLGHLCLLVRSDAQLDLHRVPKYISSDGPFLAFADAATQEVLGGLSTMSNPQAQGSRQCARSQAAFVAAAMAVALLPLVVVDAAGSGLPSCSATCGGVSVPYPFGIEPGCHLERFDVICDTRYTPQRMRVWEFLLYISIVNISVDDSTMLFDPNEVRIPFTLNKTDSVPPLLPGPVIQLPIKHFLILEWYVPSNALQRPNEKRAGNATCPWDLGARSCHSNYSTCETVSDPFREYKGYTCRCNTGFQGNPYLPDGCQEIPERTFDEKLQHPNPGLMIGLGVGSGVLVLLLSLSTIFVIHKIKTQRKKRLRQRFFKQNRGQLLQQLVRHKGDIVESMIVTLEELEKATNNFDKSRELGGGGHGTVYKGILSSLHVVAIKKSKIVIQKEIDDFINEVAILYQINHRNIVKLLGCCLETEVPLLIYEFISNGTLYDHLHVEALASMPWKGRLRIAVEIARALAYLHSLVTVPIVHRDVKSPNILLDGNLTVKLSDFGASRYVPLDQTGLDTTVQGTFGYLDPMYHSTGHLTEKSDVYSFGVILIELLTRKKPISYRSSQGHGLVYHFVNLLFEGNLAHILDPQVAKEGGGEVNDVALLAAICVKHVSKERPKMRHVEMVLEGIHAAKEDVPSNITSDESEDNYVYVNNRSIGGTNLDAARRAEIVRTRHRN
ncbi:hypothetical protein ACP4OV_003300 [Aristida adscensionis]